MVHKDFALFFLFENRHKYIASYIYVQKFCIVPNVFVFVVA
jgi:hypothetical protein